MSQKVKKLKSLKFLLEKVLSQKFLRPSAGKSSMVGSSPPCISDMIGEISTVAQHLKPRTEDSNTELVQNQSLRKTMLDSASSRVPTWLEQEMNGAEYIPLNNSLNKPGAAGTTTVHVMKESNEESLEDVIQKLKLENENLKMDMENKKQRIKLLESKLLKCQCEKSLPGCILEGPCIAWEDDV